jgi:putative nucleotidyltransferase with HDIG domain
MERDKSVFAKVSELYSTADTSMGSWMWRNHTQWVADKAKQLAEKYGADSEIVYCSALLHDLGDSRYERGHANFDTWSLTTSIEILTSAGFRKNEQNEILEAIRTHSSRSGNLPKALEGKILATADGMWHLQTNFFPIICYMNRPDNTHSYEEWQEWFANKIERDFGPKIFFEDERSEVKENYETLKKVFGNKSLSSDTG